MPHIHEVLDADKRFIIDPCTGELVNYTPEKNNVRQFAHNSERLTFELPRIIEGHDMSTCNIVEVHFISVDAVTGAKNPGLYLVKDLAPAANADGEETVKCSWLISKEATQLAGPLLFRLNFICSNNGNIDYLWPTAIYRDFSVADGINNTSYVVDAYPDVLVDFNDRLRALEAPGGGNVDLSGYVKTVNGVGPDANGNVNTPSSDSVQNAALTAEQKTALDGLLNVTAFTRPDVSAEIAAFREAFGLDGGDDPEEPVDPEEPAKTLASISAAYSGGAVPVGTVVTALTGVTVTAHYSDGTSAAVTGYSLSGVIAEGDNIITVTYQGQATTITVVGTAEAEEPEQPDDAFDTGLIVLTEQHVGNNGKATQQILDNNTLIVTKTQSGGYAYILVNGLTAGTNYELYMKPYYGNEGNASVYTNTTPDATDDSGYGTVIRANTTIVGMYDPLSFTLPSGAYGIIIYCYDSVTKIRLVEAEG